MGMTEDTITIYKAAELSGLSVVTLKRAVQIANGNRHSYGRARMPGLRSMPKKFYNVPTMVRISDLKAWLKARAGYTQNGVKRR